MRVFRGEVAQRRDREAGPIMLRRIHGRVDGDGVDQVFYREAYIRDELN